MYTDRHPPNALVIQVFDSSPWDPDNIVETKKSSGFLKATSTSLEYDAYTVATDIYLKRI